MKTCTEAERKLLDAVMAQESTVDAEIHAVLLERLPEDLREQAIRARLDLKRASRNDTAVWDKLTAVGFKGRMQLPKLWDEVDRIAEERLKAGQ